MLAACIQIQNADYLIRNLHRNTFTMLSSRCQQRLLSGIPIIRIWNGSNTFFHSMGYRWLSTMPSTVTAICKMQFDHFIYSFIDWEFLQRMNEMECNGNLIKNSMVCCVCQSEIRLTVIDLWITASQNTCR